MRVCIYAIMRDEEPLNTIAWAETTLDADTRFVLDTGSTDSTPGTLRTAGVNVAHATFTPFRFDDARNCALALAPAADLYFRLDADERLEDHWRDQLEANYHPNLARYRYTVVNHGEGWGQHTRDDIHARAGFRWRYPTHEVLVGPVTTLLTPIVVHHHPGARRPHHDTNLAVLADATWEYPGNHRMAFYYGRELWYAGRWTEMRLQMQRFLDLPGGWPAERAEAYRIIAAVDDDPERWLWKAIGECPERREPWVDLAVLMMRHDHRERAAAMIAEASIRTDASIYTTDASAWGAPFDNLYANIFSIAAK
jgi:glycosyltransferase involved in cell wall biosynthesis